MAIKHFNIARLDRDYEADALAAMIENCLSLSLRRVSATGVNMEGNGGPTTGPLSGEEGVKPIKGIPALTSGEEIARHSSGGFSASGFGDFDPTQMPAYDAETAESTAYETTEFLLAVSATLPFLLRCVDWSVYSPMITRASTCRPISALQG